MEAVELDHVGPAEWEALLDGERQAWGPLGETLTWAPKQRHVAVLGDDGAPLALGGAVTARLAVDGGEPFDVVGIGSVIVTHRMRGKGLGAVVVEAIMRLASELGPDRAMLFCREQLTGMYAHFGFRAIDGRATAEQPAGRIEIPMRAMWAPLHDEASWPPGRVEVLGEPF